MSLRSNMEPHWGPRIDKIPLAGGIGLIIGIGLMIGFLGSVPETRLWLYISVPLGVVFALIVRWWNRRSKTIVDIEDSSTKP